MRERRRAIGRAAGGRTVRLRGVADRVNDFCVTAILQENRFAARIQPEAKLRVVEHQKTPWRDRGPRRNHKLVRLGIVRDHAARKTHDAVPVIIQLDELGLRIVRMRENFIDHNRSLRVRRDWIDRAGRTANAIARRPCAWIAFTQ